MGPMGRWAAILTAMAICAAVPAAAQNPQQYQEGTVQPAGEHSYELTGGGLQVWMTHCGEFQPGETVQYRIEGRSIRVRDAGGNEQDCTMTEAQGSPTSAATNYETGEILGYKVRRDIVEKSVRRAKVYQLRGEKFIYLIDYCGRLQAGKFMPGQVVRFRAFPDGDRLDVLHGGNQTYSCQLEGMSLIEPDGAAQAGGGSR